MGSTQPVTDQGSEASFACDRPLAWCPVYIAGPPCQVLVLTALLYHFEAIKPALLYHFEASLVLVLLAAHVLTIRPACQVPLHPYGVMPVACQLYPRTLYAWRGVLLLSVGLVPPSERLVVSSQPVGFDFPSYLDLPGLLKSDVARWHSVLALPPCQPLVNPLGLTLSALVLR